jgi:hypothetical protein
MDEPLFVDQLCQSIDYLVNPAIIKKNDDVIITLLRDQLDVETIMMDKMELFDEIKDKVKALVRECYLVE